MIDKSIELTGDEKHHQLLQLAIIAAVEAGEEILKIYNSEFDVELKSDKSPLTEADLASNSIIMKHLQGTNIPVISEENKEVPYEIRKNWKTCWLVDPLDGTKEFVKKNGEFTVNIALIEGQNPVLGVVYVPVTGELYYSIVKLKNAAKLVVKADDPLPSDLFKPENLIKITPKRKDYISVVGSRSHMNVETQKFVDDLLKSYKHVEMVSKGSSLKFCMVAEGKADVYPRFAPTMEWDTAAGQTICEGMGFKVMSYIDSKPLRYNKEVLLNSHFLVAHS